MDKQQRKFSGKMLLLVLPALTLVANVRVGATASKSKGFTAAFSGTSVTVPLDIDLDSCSNTVPSTCTDSSSYANYTGKITGGGSFSGPFSGQAVEELVPEAGTGCSLNPTGWKSCTLGTATDACEFSIAGGSFVNQKSTGDLAYGSITPGGTECVDYNSSGGFATPYKFSQSSNWAVTGGTGKLSGSTASFTNTIAGQILSNDLQGHNFNWFAATTKGTTP